MRRVVVIGAGVGGLTTAAILSRAGFDVQVLEAHIYPGGCAGTFFHQGFSFDAGATLAGGFYPGGPMDLTAQASGIARWPAKPAEPALVVHLPNGNQVSRWGDERRFAENRSAFGESAGKFWRWQEQTADALWAFALQSPPWIPQTAAQWVELARSGVSWLGEDFSHRLTPTLLADAFRPLGAHLTGMPENLKTFVDAQLLISAQTTSASANALYGASALDLPRRGVVHLEGGIGAIAQTLTQAVRDNGGQVLFRKEATRIVVEKGRPVAVEIKRHGSLPADIVIANLPPWNIARLLAEQAPSSLRNLPAQPGSGWGAFMVYAGVDQTVLPENFPLHHQCIIREPFGEGNTVFLSLSPEWDRGRAPDGQRALTISTHTDFRPWWDIYQHDPQAYITRKQRYSDSLIRAAERVIPGFREATNIILPGTPLSFERFTRRAWGWVGGFPQTSLFQRWGPRLSPGIWMVGDSIFPGQSVAAVALGGMRVARDILHTVPSGLQS